MRLAPHTTGDRNTAVGEGALLVNRTGASNTAVGVSALRNNTTAADNTAVGHDALDNNNTAVGFRALLSNNTGGGNTAEGFQALVRNTTGLSNIAVGGNAGGNLTTGSNNIDIGAPGVAGEAKTIRVGVQADLVARDEEGKVYTVRYEAVNAMLLNEFLKEHGQVQELKGTVAEQQKPIRALTASLKEQAAQIQKVSAQLDVSKTAPQIVINDQ